MWMPLARRNRKLDQILRISDDDGGDSGGEWPKAATVRNACDALWANPSCDCATYSKCNCGERSKAAFATAAWSAAGVVLQQEWDEDILPWPH